MRSITFFLLLLLVVPLLPASAFRPYVASEGRFHLDEDLPGVIPFGPVYTLYIRPEDGPSQEYHGNDIPSSVEVSPGTIVQLVLTMRVNKKGNYSIRSEVEVLTDLPSGEARDIVAPGGSTISDKSSGDAKASSAVKILKYYPGLRVRLRVTYSERHGGQEEVGGKSVIVICKPPIIIPPPPPQPTSMPPWLFTSETTSTSTRTSGSHTRTSESNTTSSPTQIGLSLNPTSQEVDAGKVASYDFCTSLSNPTFGVEGLPTGYRYVISKEGSCYRLKITTYPHSYGRFDMTLIVRSDGNEERAGFILMVKRATGSSTITGGSEESKSHAPSNSTPSLGLGNGTRASERVSASSLFSPSSPPATAPVVTVTTVVEEPSVDFLLGGLAGVLALLVIILLLRRR